LEPSWVRIPVRAFIGGSLAAVRTGCVPDFFPRAASPLRFSAFSAVNSTAEGAEDFGEILMARTEKKLFLDFLPNRCNPYLILAGPHARILRYARAQLR
jgi:hypothetical protein